VTAPGERPGLFRDITGAARGTGGERFTTDAVRAEAGSRNISVNGVAAHKARPGDRVIICAYGAMSEQEARLHKPRLVYLDETNRVTRTGSAIPVQAA
jgi:aspartate 1-decarboxylase